MILKLILFLILSCSIQFSSGDCVLPYPRFKFTVTPLVFTSDGTLYPSNYVNDHETSITVPTGSGIVISCAPHYFISFRSSKTVSAVCKDGEVLEVNGVEKAWNPTFECENRPTIEILKPVPGCDDPNIGVEFGYENPIKAQTLVLGEACYSENVGRTLFIHTKHIGSDYKYLLKTENIDYLKQIPPKNSYKYDFASATRLMNPDKQLQKLSLEKLPVFKARTFLNMTSIPNGQLKRLLRHNWNLLVMNGKNYLSNYALLLKDIFNVQQDFDVYWGTHSTLALKNTNQEFVDVYLLPEEQKFPVPKYLWATVITDESPKKAAAFFISNNIESSEQELSSSAPCESKCTQMTWLTNLLNDEAYRNPKNGYVWCCDIDSFKPQVDEMPAISGSFTLFT